MPPSVACALVETSTGIPQAVLLQLRRSGGPARCRARPRRCARSASKRRTLRTCLRVSMTSAGARRSGRTGWCRRRAARWAPSGRGRCPAPAATSSLRARHEHADRHHLVDRCVGGVAAAVGGGEQHFALGLGGQALASQRRRLRCRPGDRVVGARGARRATFSGSGAFMRRLPLPARLRLARNCSSTTSRLLRRCAASSSRSAGAVARGQRPRSSSRAPCTARFHFSPSWLERKRSACSRALTWL